MASYRDSPPSETTPLISRPFEREDANYERFSFWRKQAILLTVCGCCLLNLFTACSFSSTIPQIANEFNTTGGVVNISVGLFLFTTAAGSLFWARYSAYYGRQPIYVVSLPLYIFASLGVASCRTVPELMVYRTLQAFGSAGFQSLGAAVIADIFKLEERGRAMAIYGCFALLGPALAPFIGGLVSEQISWRFMQAFLGLIGLMALVIIITSLPETMHPGTRGMDKVDVETEKKGPLIVLLNPFSPLALMKSPVLSLTTIASGVVVITQYVILLPLAYTIAQRYGIENKALVGALFLPYGLGNIIGMPISGWLSDSAVKSWRVLRGGKWVPEDRLRATWHGSLYIVPLATMALGLVIQFVDGMWGIWMSMLLLLVHGIGMCLVISPCSTYNVDAMQDRSAEAVAAKNATRTALVSTFVFAIFPAIELMGVAWTNIVAAIFAWIGFGYVLPRMRIAYS
ncbi:MFS general substrate transporter [Sistotremastrum suecicum HHB10207 ss-3]|uniref:MFS general substrate transporter n=1 Tax=Sistotremastrum suecicum HHB10207 ss-3 TaxID=1314776 RepID=A0A166C9Q7_9AGAM|nr:MFS general substrate transporter [Sistotremastrum suecicum HHB10207 ss-3]